MHKLAGPTPGGGSGHRFGHISGLHLPRQPPHVRIKRIRNNVMGFHSRNGTKLNSIHSRCSCVCKEAPGFHPALRVIEREGRFRVYKEAPGFRPGPRTLSALCQTEIYIERRFRVYTEAALPDVGVFIVGVVRVDVTLRGIARVARIRRRPGPCVDLQAAQHRNTAPAHH